MNKTSIKIVELSPEDKAKYMRVSNELIDIMHYKHGLNPGECSLVLRTMLEFLNEIGVYGAMFKPSQPFVRKP